jgi:hypothetical protein
MLYNKLVLNFTTAISFSMGYETKVLLDHNLTVKACYFHYWVMKQWTKYL